MALTLVDRSITCVMTLCAAAAFSATMATAEESGQVTVTIAGEALPFPLNAGQSDWSGAESYASVSINARPTDEGIWARYKSVAVSFELNNGVASVGEVSLRRVGPSGDIESYFGKADQGGVAIDVSENRVDGDFLHVSGSFTGMLGSSADYGRTIDLSDPVQIDATFDVVLGPVE